MKILFAIKALDNIKGGAERVLADVSAGLAAKGHDVSVLSFDPPGGQPFYPLNKKVRRITLGIGNAQSKATGREVIARMIALRRAAIETHPDVIVAFMHSTFIPAAFALIGTGIPLIASEHIVPNHYTKRKGEYLLLWLSTLFVKKITVLSEAIIQSYPSFLRSKMIAVANPVHQAKTLARPGKEGNDRNIILNIGRLTAQKDQATLIRAFAQLADRHPDWDLHIFGEGELRPALEKLIAERDLSQRVFLPGSTVDIEQHYQTAHIFALPSRYESFGLATAEAMAHGLPTIGFSDCPGTNELIIHEENGLLIDGEKDRVQALTDGLETLILSPALRKTLGDKAPVRITPFHPDEIVAQWESLIAAIKAR